MRNCLKSAYKRSVRGVTRVCDAKDAQRLALTLSRLWGSGVSVVGVKSLNEDIQTEIDRLDSNQAVNFGRASELCRV
jgi:hypothetical protein